MREAIKAHQMQSRHRVSSVEKHVQLICRGTLCEDGRVHWELFQSKERREGVELGTGLRGLRKELVVPQHLDHDTAEDVGGERSGTLFIEEHPMGREVEYCRLF